MKSTHECIKYVSSHPWHKKGFSKLKQNEIEFIVNFLNIDMEKVDAMIKCNRIFVDREKTKNFTTVLEIISVCITYRY